MKKTICLVMSLVILLSYSFMAFAVEEMVEERGVVSYELQQQLGLTEKEILMSAFEEDGELFCAVIWITDIDMEPAIRYGIDMAEATREEPVEKYRYPYEVFEENGIKDIIVDIPETENDAYVQAYIEAKRSYAKQLYIAQNEGVSREIGKGRNPNALC